MWPLAVENVQKAVAVLILSVVIDAVAVSVPAVDADEGKLKIEGPDPQAGLDQLQQNGGLVISSGKLVHFEVDDDEGETTFKFHKGVLKVQAPSATLFLLRVTCTDESGNVGAATATPTFTDDDEGDEDENDEDDDEDEEDYEEDDD